MSNHRNRRPHGAALFPEVSPEAYTAWHARMEAEQRAAEHQRMVQLCTLLLLAALIILTAATLLR